MADSDHPSSKTALSTLQDLLIWSREKGFTFDSVRIVGERVELGGVVDHLPNVQVRARKLEEAPAAEGPRSPYEEWGRDMGPPPHLARGDS